MKRTNRSTLVLGLALFVSQPAAGEPAQGNPAGLSRLEAAPGVIQEITLGDGSRFYGHVASIDGDRVVFETTSGVRLEVVATHIAEVREVRGRMVDGEFRVEPPTKTRLFFAPTARGLRRGEGYLGVYEIYFPFVQVGLTDRISIGGGSPLMFFGMGAHPVWLTPKVQVIDRARQQAAVGLIHITDGSHNMGIVYGVATFGSFDSALTTGLGYGYAGNHHSGILMVGGEHRTSRRIKVMTENWIFGRAGGVVSGGVRFMGDHLSADLALVVPISHGEPLGVGPLVNFVWSFDARRSASR